MKQNLSLLTFLAIAASARLQAGNLAWDSSQTPLTPSGGTGTWNLANAFWSNGATDVAWVDTTGSLDVATFGGAAGVVTLGANVGAKGLVFTTAGHTLTGSTLTLGNSGINASTLASGTTTISSNLTLATGHQVWNTGSGSTLALTTGTFTRTAGTTVNLQGAGTVSSSMTGLANTNNILGPWATVGSGASTRYATLSGGNLVAYTGGTASTTFGYTSNAAINYDVSGIGGPFGSSRLANSVRYTGAAGTLASNSTQTYTMNGLMNVGTGTLTLQTTAGSGNILNLAIGTNNELVLAAANANITVNSIVSGAAGAGVTVTGPGTVTLAGTNTFSGNLVVNSGTLAAGTGQGAAPTASNLGSLSATRSIIVNDGGTLSLTGGNVLGTGGSTNTLATVTTVVNQGGLFQSGLNGAGTGWWNKVGALTLNGGTVRVGSGANTGAFQGLALIGNVTVAGTAASSIENHASSNSASNGIHLGQNATAGQIITFDVADVTGSAASDLSVSAKLLNTSSTLTASGLTKTGAGTMTLSAASAYTGATTISAGTLQLGNGTTDGSISTSSGITNNAALVYNLVGSQSYGNAIGGSGTLTKTGAGSLTLSGTSNYAGATTVNQGALLINGTLTSSVAVNSGATVGGIGSTTGSLTMNGGSTLSLPGTSTTSSLSSVGVNFAGVTALTFDSAPVAGTYDVVKYGGGGVTNLGNLTSATIRAVIADDSANQKVTAAVSTGTRTWTTTNGNWENGGANTNWQEGDQKFFSGDTVVFGDPAAASTVTLAGSLTPASISVSNTNSYVFSGSGSITGAASLTKSGAGSLAVNNVNSFTGGTTISGGSVVVGISGALGSGAVGLNGGVLDINGNTVANVISLGGGAVSGGGTISSAFTGASALVKSGAGTLVLTAANNHAGGTTINNGAVTVNGAGSLGSGTIAVAGGAALNLSGNPYALSNTVTGSGTITASNTTTVTGDFSGFGGTYIHNTTAASTAFNTAAATSKDAVYQISSAQGSAQGMIAGGNGDYTLEMGSLAGVANSMFRGGNTATGTTTLQVGNLDADTDFGGIIANGATKTVAFTKVGSGTQTLSGASTYTGATTVSAGTLLVNGSLGNTAVGVTGGTLGGTGAIAGAVAVSGSGKLSAGASIQSLATGALTMGAGSTFVFEAADNSSTGADLLVVNGSLSLSDVSLDLSGAALALGIWNPGDKLTLISYTGTGITGGFTGFDDDSDYSFGANQWRFNYNDATAGEMNGYGNNFASEALVAGTSFVTMTVVPEPSAALIGGLGMLALLRRRRED